MTTCTEICPEEARTDVRADVRAEVRPTSLQDAHVAVVLAAAQRGEPAAWEELVRRYRHLLEMTVARFRLNAADTADVIQTTWLRLIEHSRTIRDTDKVGAWLATTARRECLMLMRRRRAECLVGSSWDEPACSAPTPESVVLAADARRTVRAVTAELTGRPAQLVEALFFREPESYADLSSRLGIPVGSIGPTRARVMDRLRHRLREVEV